MESDLDFVLPVEAVRGLDLMPVCVATVAAQHVSALVKALSDACGQPPELSHLKRVRRPSVAPGSGGGRPNGRPEALQVLCWSDGPEALESLPVSVAEAVHSLGAKLARAHVPRHAPITREQFDEWGAVWPLVFHQAAAARSLMMWAPEKPVSRPELEWMASQMRIALRLAVAAAKAGGRPVGAVIARPLGDALAACGDGTFRRPQGGGDSAVSGLVAAASDTNAAQQPRQPRQHPLQHALMQCVGCVAEAQRRRRDGAAGPKRGAAALSPELSHDAAATEGDRKGDREGEHGGEQYLCAGCDVFVTIEPCAMCAMGLVHSRIRR